MSDFLNKKYKDLGVYFSNEEAYFPIKLYKEILLDLEISNIAVIGIEFFHINHNGISPVNPINGLDCSNLLFQCKSWNEVVDKCNKLTLYVLDEEIKKDNTQFFNLTLFTINEWNKLT